MAHAVVVGISHYPGLSANGADADLHGPDADAQAVYDWLVDPDGGALPPDNVRLVRTGQFDADPDDPQPERAAVEKQLKWVERRTRDEADDRLYLYFSGHGFSPVLEEGAIFTADADLAAPEYVYAHAWLRWFRKAQRFGESVLWMDACMTYQHSVPVREVPMRAQIGTGVPGPAFVALAAQTKNALELRMADGEVHGVFTWALLQGLRGGATDGHGRVTGESLRAFLHNAVPELLPREVRGASTVDLQPFVRADEGMVFRRSRSRPQYDVTLTLPASAHEQELHIWSGRPPMPIVRATVTGPSWSGRLTRGLYVAEVPDAGLRQGFQVTGTGAVSVEVARTGPPVEQCDGSEVFGLRVRARNAAASVAIIDTSFERILTDTGGLDEQEPPGIYKVRVQLGRSATAVDEAIVLLDRDLDVTAEELSSGPPPPAAGAVAGSARVSAGAAAGPARARSLSSAPALPAIRARPRAPAPAPARGCGVRVVARYAGGPPQGVGDPARPHPLAGLELRDDAGDLRVRLEPSDAGSSSRYEDPASRELQLAPGTYLLRQELSEGTCEGSVVVSLGWITEVVVLRTMELARGRPAGAVVPPEDVSVVLHPVCGQAPGDDRDVVEVARRALAEGQDLLGRRSSARLEEVLLGPATDPLASIIGAHLLLRTADAAAKPDASRAGTFDRVVTELRGQVGGEHPDVEALSLRCSDPALRRRAPLLAAPMFAQSWALAVEASYAHPELIPLELFERVHASARLGSWLVWAVDEPTRARHWRQLGRWMADFLDDGAPAGPDAGRLGPPAAAADAGRRLLLPAAAVASLWEQAPGDG